MGLDRLSFFDGIWAGIAIGTMLHLLGGALARWYFGRALIARRGRLDPNLGVDVARSGPVEDSGGEIVADWH